MKCVCESIRCGQSGDNYHYNTARDFASSESFNQNGQGYD